MSEFHYSDIHCHPNLKTFGHSFDKNANRKSHLWYYSLPAFLSRQIHKYTGITKFTQTDFSTMARAGAKIIFVSLYPFEKGLFINKNLSLAVAAFLADWGTEIGYNRVKYLQEHKDYFKDLQNEYDFFVGGEKQYTIDGKLFRWEIANNWKEVNSILKEENTTAVILSIEGGHVFNSGLDAFGVDSDEKEILSNLQAVKNWDHVPLFMGLAHNFNNDLCGHARSLQRIGKLVNQENNIDNGISVIGNKVIHALLDDTNGKRIYIDLKHMSVKSRQEYYAILKVTYPRQKIPLIVSHGSVTGLSFSGSKRATTCLDIFNTNDLNFFDEEIMEVAKSGGLFAIQMDIGNNADLQKLKTVLSANYSRSLKTSAQIIWNQLQYIAELLDSEGLYAWGCTSIGSDFDGSINPFPEILTATGFSHLANELVEPVEIFLSSYPFKLAENKNISSIEIVDRFIYLNTVNFLQLFY